MFQPFTNIPVSNAELIMVIQSGGTGVSEADVFYSRAGMKACTPPWLVRTSGGV